MSEQLHSVASSTFVVFGVELTCHVLSDGQRVIEANEAFERFLNGGGSPSDDPGDLQAFARWRAERLRGAR